MIVAVDVDSTLYDSSTLFAQVALEHYGTVIPIDATNWHDYYNHATVSTLLKIFRKSHSADNVKVQKPYPYAVEVCDMIQDKGHELYFVSDRHPQSATALDKWLHDCKFLYEESMGRLIVGKDKRAWLKEFKPSIVIDDRVRTLVFARYEIDATCFSIKQPWNVNLSGEVDDIFVLDNWQEIGEKIEEYI